MASSTITPDYKLEIPTEVREALGFKPGEEIGFLVSGSSVRLVRVRTLDQLRGTLRGDWSDYRDEEDEPR